MLLAACTAARSPRTRSWDAMSYDERLAYMQTTFTPAMERVFARFDEHRYPKTTCATCHGADGEARRYKMPNPDLLLEDPREAMHHDELERFMKEQVTPELSRLLGKKSDCFACHTLDR